jgi:hypothetical protein
MQILQGEKMSKLERELKEMQEYIELPSKPIWRESKHKPKSIATLRRQFGL